MHNMKSIMVQLKCPDCGQAFDTGKSTCPTCGCPADACTQFASAPDQKKTDGTEGITSEKRTTDTGYTHEKTISTYANVIFLVNSHCGNSYMDYFDNYNDKPCRGNRFCYQFLFGRYHTCALHTISLCLSSIHPHFR